MYVSRISRTGMYVSNANKKLNIGSKSIETENNEARTEEKTNKVLEPNSSKDIEATKAVSYESSETVDVQDTKNQSSENQNTEKQKRKSEFEGLEPISSRSSATFRDKFRTELAKTSKLLNGIMNLLRSLWNDRSGNVGLVKKSRTFKWRPISGFQVSLNQIQTRLVKHTYPCKNKILIFCTQKRKPRYLCKLARIEKDNLWWYNQMLFCKCYDEDDCVQQGASCFYNMIHDSIDECPWSRTMLEEQWIFEKNLKKMMEIERKKEKLKNRLRGVKNET